MSSITSSKLLVLTIQLGFGTTDATFKVQPYCYNLSTLFFNLLERFYNQRNLY